MSEALANLEAERGLLGALMAASRLRGPQEARALLEQSLVVPDRLYWPAHRDALAAITRLLDAGDEAEPVILAAQLRGSSAVAAAGGAAWVSALEDAGSYPHQIPVFAEQIRAMALRRKLVQVAGELAVGAQELAADPAEALARASSALAGITLTKREIRTLSEVMQDVIDEFEAAQRGERSVVPTGFPHLDAIIGGWQPTLCVVGAYPGVGKSALFASTVAEMAKAGHRVGLFSLEDDATWLGWRYLAHESGIAQFALRNIQLNEYRAQAASHGVERISRYASNVLIDDRSALSPREVVQTARDMIVNRGCRCILIDHLGELRFEGRHQERYDLEIEEGLTDLRGIAKAHRVPVVVAAHLKRKPGAGSGTKPEQNDFANSAAIERKARLILGLSREPDSDELQAHVLKQTSGKKDITINLKFVGLAAMVADAEGPIEDWYGEKETEVRG